MNAVGYAANFLGWPVVQMTIASLITRIPQKFFKKDTWLTAHQFWEKNGEPYNTWFSVRRWKHRLPDGASWLGGFPKKKILSHDTDYLVSFVCETRRAEIAHWCMLGCFPIFFIWNPPWAWLVMIAYAVAANSPCIIVQRYNRAVLLHVLKHRNHAVAVQ